MVSTIIDVISNQFPRLVAQVDDRVNDALDVAVLTAIETADPLTRRDTGALVGNKTIERDAESRTIHWNQEYAAYQEFGTYKMSGTHFASNGADAGIDRLQAELAGGLF